MWLAGFTHALSGANLLWLLLGTGVGLIVGVLPALGPNFGVALMLPFTFGMDPAAAIIFLCAIQAACSWGDSVASILLNTPGGPGTVATCWEGYPLAQQGKAGKALGIATLSSFIGGAVIWVGLALLARPITEFALAIGGPEYFALGVMALGLVSVASKGETLKGLIMACLGLVLSTVGQDQATGLTYRFSYGITSLEAGIPIVVSTLGVFAISQVMVLLGEGGTVAKTVDIKDSVLSGFIEVVRRPLTLLRATSVGGAIGILPALGTSVAGIASYLVEKKYSKESPHFGKGAPAGLVAAEVGKGACVMGDLIPTFTLGVPGSVTGAILMAALIIQGIDPGPRFLLQGALPYTVFAGLFLAQASFLISGVVLGKWLSRIIYLPNALIAPALTVLAFLGAYAERNYTFDIPLALAFGAFAYALEKLGYPVVCMVLGLILGPLVEANFHRSLAISFGSYSVFLTRPIAAVMLAVTLFWLLWPYLLDFFRGTRRRAAEPAGAGAAEHGQVEVGQGVFLGELLLLVGIALLLSAFLYTARSYEPRVRLFPDVVSSAGLVLVLYRLAGMILRRPRRWYGFSLKAEALFQGRLSWHWSLLTMVAYAFLVYVLGFVVASALYVAGVILLTGFQKWSRAVLTGIVIALSILLLAKSAHLLLPAGLFALFR